MTETTLIRFIRAQWPVALAHEQEILRQFTPKQIKKGDFFLLSGTVSDEYLFLEKGCMRAFTLDYNGNEVTTQFYFEKGVVFEPVSFFMRTASQEHIQALTDCTGYVVSFERLNHLFHTIPEFREFGRAALVRAFAAYKERSLSFVHLSAEQRYIQLMAQRPEIFKYAQMKQIASYLGITDTSFSRIRRTMAKGNDTAQG